MNEKRIRSLTKREIIQLPGFDKHSNKSLRELKAILTTKLTELGINRRGIRVQDYINAYNQREKQTDDALFNRMTQTRMKQKQQKQKREQYRKQLKDTATEERSILNVNPLYQDTKTLERKYYEENVSNKKKFEATMKQMMLDSKKHVGCTVDIGDDNEKLYAFTKLLHHLHQHQKSTDRIKPVVFGEDLNGTKKIFTLTNNLDINLLINNILDGIDIGSTFSDTPAEVIGETFIPDKFQIVYVDRLMRKLSEDHGPMTDKAKRTEFTAKMRSPETNKIEEQGFEVVDDYRSEPDGEFFPFINTSDVDLTSLQIFSKVDKNNYRDNCFVYACIQSGVLTDKEIHHLRSMMFTRSLPNNKIISISKHFKVNFVVIRYEQDGYTSHVNIDTRKTVYGMTYTRCIKLILYYGHYMLNQKIQYKNKQIKPMKILRQLFKERQFREIKQCELNILSTVEFDNHLNDYVDLEYDEHLCCKEETSQIKQASRWSRIYYADFETDTTTEHHTPYLCCVCHSCRDSNSTRLKPMGSSFTGENISVPAGTVKRGSAEPLASRSLSTQLLDYLYHNSLTYFHNLKYDACFFINEPGWSVKITERTGTVLQIVMDKYDMVECNGRKKRTLIKRLTFRNSYSLIPAPLSSFANMFDLTVHKERMPYKLYTQHNLSRGSVSAVEFQLQYYHENYESKGMKQTINEMREMFHNAVVSNAYDEATNTVNIMKYAEYYCMRDCLVLMKGMMKFDDDIDEVFRQNDHRFLGINQFVSISAIGYDFARIYGCFNECYKLSGKPQNFIQRCVSGGRTMTANNEKQYVTGRLQDFDAVSLYPSAMSIMHGIPKGKPQVIPQDITHEQLMQYDAFFVEIDIISIRCKASKPYAFGLIHEFQDDHKLFGNNPVKGFYVDKVSLQDLMDAYELEYKFIRGYYFDEGFNDNINSFITHLFELRREYQKQHNPLEKTIKLLLNSIYGKSILKPMTNETKLVDRDRLTSYVYRHYNFIKDVTIDKGIQKAYVRRIKPINNHFNLPQFGASVLSWSKHIMNQVMVTAEQHNIPIFYQDTDSMHLYEDDVNRLANIYREKYGKELIGKDMTQFHCDFDNFAGSVGSIHSRKLIALGKKSYLDILVDERGNEGYHIRMKGVPSQCIINKCKRMGITVEELYERMYIGEVMEFNLVDGCNCFKKTKTYQQLTLPQFIRRLHF